MARCLKPARICVALLVMAVALADWLAASTPQWWKGASGYGPADDQRAGQLETHFTAALHRLRENDQPWAIEIEAEDLNRWLACRAVRWADFDPELASLSELARWRLDARAGRLLVAADQGGWIMGASLQPGVETGGLELGLAQASIGSLRVPASLGSGALHSLQPELRRLMQLKLVDGRTVELVDIELLPGRIVLQMRTRGP